MNKTILLLNPPSNSFLQRDLLCSASSKADYYWPPIDLLVLTGILKDYNIKVLDAVIEEKNDNDVMNFYKNEKFNYIISLCSSVDFENQIRLFKEIKKINPKCKIIVSGDIAFFETEKVIKNNEVDAILMKFITHDIIEYIENSDNKKIKDITYKINNKILFNGYNKEIIFTYNEGNHKLFNIKKYNLPYSVYNPMALVLTNYGCPYKCTFCSSGLIGYGIREIKEVLNEIESLSKQGFKEIFMRDLNFTSSKERVKQICNFIIEKKLNIVWSCEGRVDNVDYELLSLMKKAGCYLIFFGVESASQEKLNQVNKGISIEQIEKIFSYCNKLKIKTLASFIIGLPGDTKQDILNTIALSKRIKTNYASFNMYVPRYGSILRKELEEQNKIKKDDKFDSSKEINNFTDLSDKEIKELHKYAVKSFYFRPIYIIKSVFDIKTKNQLKYNISNGLNLLRQIMKHRE